jgi:hypothetical protein
MKAIWFDGYKDKQARLQEIMGYRNAFDDLKEILNKHYKKKDACRDYEVPNWELRQVSVNEYNQVLNDILELITLSKD